MAKANKKPDKPSDGIVQNITAASVRGNPKPGSKSFVREGWKNLSGKDDAARTTPGMGEIPRNPKQPGKPF